VILDWIQRGRELVAHDVHTHQMLENMMRDLDNCDAGTPAFISQLRRIATAFEQFRQAFAIALSEQLVSRFSVDSLLPLLLAEHTLQSTFCNST
jgi:hypothetical protein